MTTPRRRRLISSFGALLLLVAALLVSAPSTAASYSGALRIKGPGSVYSGNESLVSLPVAVGGTAKFGLQVANTGPSLAQFNVKVVSYGLPANANLYAGTLVLTPLSSGPDGYYTAPIAAGRSQALTLKVTVPAGSPQGSAGVEVYLYATDGSFLTYVNAIAEVKAPAYGTTATDAFAKQGSQAYVGGSVSAQIATSPALNVGSSAAFTVKLQNDGPVPAAIQGRVDTFPSCTSIVVKDGTADVTAALASDTYSTPVLAVHAARTLKVTITRISAGGCSTFDFASFYAHTPGYTDSHYVYTLVPFPAT